MFVSAFVFIGLVCVSLEAVQPHAWEPCWSGSQKEYAAHPTERAAIARKSKKMSPQNPQSDDETLERFTDESRKALFFARAAVSEKGGARVDTPHLLLGLVEAVPDIVARFITADWSPERLAQSVTANLPVAAKVEETVGIPFTKRLRNVVERAAKEADHLGARPVRPEHILLALLSADGEELGALLQRAGVTREAVMAALKG